MGKATSLYYVELENGTCGIRAASSLRTAVAGARREQGRDNVRAVRRATCADVARVSGMGGRVPGQEDGE